MSLGQIKSVCIIGAGPSGLAAAKYLRDEDASIRISIFERGTTTGGLWKHVSFPKDMDQESLKALEPCYLPDLELSWQHEQSNCWIDARSTKSTVGPIFWSPVYDHLETNIPRDIMVFTDHQWPDDTPLFPPHCAVLKYIQSYGSSVLPRIRFCTQVTDIRLNDDLKWMIQSQHLTKDASIPQDDELFDAVIVANGHFNEPYTPDIPGIMEWSALHPGSIIHSKFYRNAQKFANRKVIVVGNSASGIDIASQVQRTCKPPLIISSRSVTTKDTDEDATRGYKPPISKFLPRDRRVEFEDGSHESDVPAVIFCTGYLYSYPFLSTLDPPVVKTGERVINSYLHIFYRPCPSLAFVGLNQKVIPFPIAEAQSAVIASVFSGRNTLPSPDEMRAWEVRTMVGLRERDFHVMSYPKDADYLDMLHDMSLVGDKTRRSPKECRSPVWDTNARRVRELCPEIKAAFLNQGSARCKIRRISELGIEI